MPAKKAVVSKKDSKAKKKEEKVKETPKDSSDEEVIEVNTTKKDDFPKEEAESEDVKGSEITSFSQLDTDKAVKDKEKESEVEAKTEEVEAEKTEVEETPAELDAKTEKSSQDEAKKWLEGPSPEIETEDDGEKKSKVKILLIIVFIAAVLGAIGGGIYYYRSTVTQAPDGETTTEPTSAPVTSTPTPAVEDEELDLSEYSVSVLNGSGVPGEAGNAEELLTDGGFSEFETGNADSYDFEQTEVSLKKDTPVAVYNAIEEALSDTYDVSKSDTSLSEDSSFDVIVIVGTKK